MNAQTLARRAYGDTASTARTPRSIEYDLLAKVTHRIKTAALKGRMGYPQLVEALSDNQRLWTALAIDVADPDNGLPADLRARLFYLAEFVQQHTSQILLKKARITPLLEVNVAVMRGLSQKGPVT